jgi:hypothetical protein
VAGMPIPNVRARDREDLGSDPGRQPA